MPAREHRAAVFTSHKKGVAMQYGKGAGPSVAGIAVLPFTGSNDSLFIVAASLIGLGLAVFAASLILARKNRPVSAS